MSPLLFAALLQSAPAIPAGEALTEAIAQADAELFATFFEACDPPHLRAQLTDDLEMYHDRDGVVATSADAFVAAYRGNCESRAEPGAWRSRRALVPTSLAVYPVPGFGAIEEGEHLFYERRGDGPERLAGRARFLQLWRLTADGWKLARIFSHAHQAAGD